jgi:hypothetical protein
MQGQAKKYSFCFASLVLAKEKGRFFETGEANPCKLWQPDCTFAFMFGLICYQTGRFFIFFKCWKIELCIPINCEGKGKGSDLDLMPGSGLSDKMIRLKLIISILFSWHSK